MMGAWATAGIFALQLLAIVYYAGKLSAREDAVGKSLDDLALRVSRLEDVMMEKR